MIMFHHTDIVFTSNLFYFYFKKASWKNAVPRGAVFNDEFFEMDQFPVRFRGKGGVARLTEAEKQKRLSVSGRSSEYIKRCELIIAHMHIHIYISLYPNLYIHIYIHTLLITVYI